MNTTGMVCHDKCQSFANISWTRNTMSARISDLAADIASEPAGGKVASFVALSVANDNSADVTDIAHFADYVRGGSWHSVFG